MIEVKVLSYDTTVSFDVFNDSRFDDHYSLASSSMYEFINTLRLKDDVTVTLSTGQKRCCPKIIKPLSNYKTSPFPYQLDGIKYGLSGHNKWLLLDAPGLGKTLQLIYLAQELREQQGLQHCLIICGINTLKTNWKNEIEKHSDLTCRILGERLTRKGNFVIGGIQERLNQLKDPIEEFFVITNIESLREDKIVQAILKNKNNKFDMIVVDEIHKCLSYDSILQTNLGKLSIGDIVEKQIDCTVLSFNEKTQVTEYQPVESYHKELLTVPLVELTVNTPNGSRTLTCTADHEIFTYNRGYVKAASLTDTDEVEVDI